MLCKNFQSSNTNTDHLSGSILDVMHYYVYASYYLIDLRQVAGMWTYLDKCLLIEFNGSWVGINGVSVSELHIS